MQLYYVQLLRLPFRGDPDALFNGNPYSHRRYKQRPVYSCAGSLRSFWLASYGILLSGAHCAHSDAVPAGQGSPASLLRDTDYTGISAHGPCSRLLLQLSLGTEPGCVPVDWNREYSSFPPTASDIRQGHL